MRHHLHVHSHKWFEIVGVVLPLLMVILGLAGLVTAKSPNLALMGGVSVVLSLALLVLAVRRFRR